MCSGSETSAQALLLPQSWLEVCYWFQQEQDRAWQLSTCFSRPSQNTLPRPEPFLLGLGAGRGCSLGEVSPPAHRGEKDQQGSIWLSLALGGCTVHALLGCQLNRSRHPS